MTAATDPNVQLFQERYESLSGKVFLVSNSDELIDTLKTIFSEKQAKRIVTADLPEEMTDLIREIGQESNIEIMAEPYPRSILPNAIDEAEIGISAVEFAIADMGALVEVATNDETRLVSTLPDTHVAIVNAEEIVERLEDAAPRMKSFLHNHSGGVSISTISGPSRSGDIEMKLTLGVHGPKASYVIVLVDG